MGLGVGVTDRMEKSENMGKTTVVLGLDCLNLKTRTHIHCSHNKH